jgi:hypothetical protein
VSVKLCPVHRQSRSVKAEPRYTGPLSECLQDSGIAPGTHAAELFTARWYRAQMRVWSGMWRQSLSVAAILGKGPKVVAETYLGLAVSYRNLAQAQFQRLGGAK